MTALLWIHVVAVSIGTACTPSDSERTIDDANESTLNATVDRDRESTPVVQHGLDSRRPEVDAVVDGLDNVGTSVFALGSVWAVTSNLPDEFSPGQVDAALVRIDPTSRRVERVLSSPGVEPSLAEAGGLLWVKLVNRLAGLDAAGVEVASVPLNLGRSDGLVSAAGLLWVVLNGEDRIVAIDPSTAEIVDTIDTGDFPVSPVSAFGFVWIPNLIDGTLTAIDATAGTGGRVVTEFVTDGPKFVIPVPGGATGDEMWVTNTAGEVFAVSAAPDKFGQVRRLEFDRSINSVVPHGDKAALLPTWGTNVLVVDLQTTTVLAEIPVDSIPVRGLSAHGLIWVTGDGIRETLTAIDPDSIDVQQQFTIGSNRSTTTGPQQPVSVDDEVWVPNRGDDAFYIVESANL